MRSRATPAARLLPALVLPALLPALLLSGCSGSGDGDGDAGGAATPGGAPAATGTATPPAGPAAAPAPVALPRDCPGLVPSTRLVEALARPLPGPGAVVRQGPEAASGREGRTTCTWGRTRRAGEPALEVALSAYGTAEVAAGRVDATVERASGRGDAVAPQPVGAVDGFLITGRTASSVVLASGRATLVVTLARGVVPPAAVRPALVEAAQAVLDARPEPLDGAPPATPGTR
ncbi:hypothetical protein [Vallicoccus soli]|uniref:DUF3558 domain-containing protein n=1 Tax=Vallicoccus soli TaxID=2339232 RepID=A0A3A3YST8_9ACTN|nr:hypothetical protein [Vallicoccus soli]RJK93738.1 hypothetical protein D5H78_15475 [Vallicoccus soli]